MSVSPTSTNAEIVRVTSKGAGDNWTITRIQESTSARTVIVGDQIAATITVKTLTDIETAPTFTGPVTLTEAVGSSALTITGATTPLAATG